MSTQAFPFRPVQLQQDLGIGPPWGGAPSTQVVSMAEHLKGLKCNVGLLESEYIDRDYMEDHSAFYARCLDAPSNRCKRAHFFRLTKPSRFIGRQLDRKDITAIKSEVDAGSASYLGYSVIRPLRSAPMGRTALTPTRAEDHPCLRDYVVHVQGVSLTVRSLVFQQQDRAVSACATAALWTSLSRLEAMERMTSLSPAAITTMASTIYGAGRVFPSDGLSIEQICRVIHAVGASPLVITCEFDRDTVLSYCDAALRSKLAPILLISAGRGSEEVWHAVTAVGSRSSRASNPRLRKEAAPVVFDESRALGMLYIHDDRIGPFVPAFTKQNKDGGCRLDLGPGEDTWRVRNIVIPTYHKVRFSLPELMATELEIAERLRRDRPIKGVVVRRSRMVLPLADYHQMMLQESVDTGDHGTFSRYVGVVRFSVSDDVTDVVYDTTTAPGDPRHLIVLQSGKSSSVGKALRGWLNKSVLGDIQ